MFLYATAHVSTEATKGHNHTTHWTIERIVDVALLPVFPYAFYTDNVAANYVLIVLLGAHVHWYVSDWSGWFVTSDHHSPSQCRIAWSGGTGGGEVPILDCDCLLSAFP